MKRIGQTIYLIAITIIIIKYNLLKPLIEVILFYFNAVKIFFKSNIEKMIICSIITFTIITLIVLIFKKIPEKSVIKKIKQIIKFFQQFF